jgi:hypothetical protein
MLTHGNLLSIEERHWTFGRLEDGTSKLLLSDVGVNTN